MTGIAIDGTSSRAAKKSFIFIVWFLDCGIHKMPTP
jgi:hypothetical protein